MTRSLTLLLALTACGGADTPTAADAPPITPPVASAPVTLDGSSTVFPISEAVAEEFMKSTPGTRVTVGVSGTGGGMKRLCAGEVDIAGASRPIKPSEVELCAAGGVNVIELPVAYDGVVVAVNPKNDWVDTLTVAELKLLWAPEAQATVMKWNQIRPGWPDREVHLFGPGVDSGTYDYFTQAIVGKEHSSRGDFTSSEDDNVLIVGVGNDEVALGFFGMAWYTENKDTVKAIPIDDGVAENGTAPVFPSVETVRNATYQPLSRPLFIYVNASRLDRPEVQAFLDYYLGKSAALVEEVGYVPLPDRALELTRKRLADRKLGSVFNGTGSQVGVTIEDLLSKEG